jgi:hypothetical protein
MVAEALGDQEGPGHKSLLKRGEPRQGRGVSWWKSGRVFEAMTRLWLSRRRTTIPQEGAAGGAEVIGEHFNVRQQRPFRGHTYPSDHL